MKIKPKKPKQTFSWMNPKLGVRPAPKYGKNEKGVFAKENVKKGEMLAIFGGYIMTLEKENKLPKKYRDTGIQIADNFVISSKNKKENTDYFNHGCDPNAGFKGQVFLVAVKDIKKDTEVVFDYAMVLYGNNSKKSYNIKCVCGSNKCRRIVTEKDWKIPELQKKYDGYFQYFLQEKINKLNMAEIRKENIYISLDEAREEIRKRWANIELRRRVEAELGENFMPSFKDQPRGVSFRQICSPDNGFTFFCQCAKYVSVEPLIIEFHDDIFVHFNEEKKGLGRLRITLENGEKAMVDIMDFHANEKKKLKDVIIKSGDKLINFHHSLFKVLGYQVDFLENSQWFHKLGHASNYYYYFLLHFITHGVLFETFSSEDGESDLVNRAVIPAIDKINKNFGINPLIIKLYPEKQNEAEDFYWWSYSPKINDYIIEYANKNSLSFKKVI